VGQNDHLIFVNNQWTVVNPEEVPPNQPVLNVKSIDDQEIHFERKDPTGNITPFSLSKSQDEDHLPDLQSTFSFIKAMPNSQFLFDVDRHQMELASQDWLLFTNQGWKKLDSDQNIDDYVDRKFKGPLLIIDRLDNKKEAIFLVGTLYNTSRTQSQPIEVRLPHQASLETVTSTPKTPLTATPTPTIEGETQVNPPKETNQTIPRKMQRGGPRP
jgi:hypothetical protein